MRFDELTITKAAKGLRHKEFSATELTNFFLSQIDKKGTSIGAYLLVTEEIALKEAKNVDELIANNQTLPPLAGIPVAVKDVICTKGITTTAASKILEDFVPPYDATVVAKLKENHAVILGKTNCDEFAMGASTENSAYKPTKNPYDLTCVPGGSSGGSAAAVAAGMAVYSLGSDTGGSIRQPASLCGVVGLKPTYGTVSRYGLIAMGSSLDQIGPITKTVEDAAIILNAISGYDPSDANSAQVSQKDYTKNLKEGIKKIRIGLPKEYFGVGLNREVKEVVKKAIKKLEDLGAVIVDISLPYQEYALACYYIIIPSEVSANMARYDGIRFGKTRGLFGPEVKRRIILGSYTLSAGYYDQYYNQAAKVRNLIKTDFDRVFKKVDVIVGPTSPTVAWKLGEKVDDPLAMYLSDIYTVTANLVGVPAISIPCGFSDGLPIGLQIMGPHFREDLILQVAYNFEQS
jgi:aspartyl-tRNA(Asn)/glutamyl-tRNA(Gln) amidotransferase subunit A